jgi:hypothetical protein
MQLSLDPAQQLASLSLRISRSLDDLAGSVSLVLANDEGRVLGGDTIRWTKPHDVSGLSYYARKTVDLYLWGSASDVLIGHRVAFREHVDMLDLDANGELRRLGSVEARKRRR